MLRWMAFMAALTLALLLAAPTLAADRVTDGADDNTGTVLVTKENAAEYQ